jgi:hypothetical protein
VIVAVVIAYYTGLAVNNWMTALLKPMPKEPLAKPIKPKNILRSPKYFMR